MRKKIKLRPAYQKKNVKKKRGPQVPSRSRNLKNHPNFKRVTLVYETPNKAAGYAVALRQVLDDPSIYPLTPQKLIKVALARDFGMGYKFIIYPHEVQVKNKTRDGMTLGISLNRICKGWYYRAYFGFEGETYAFQLKEDAALVKMFHGYDL